MELLDENRCAESGPLGISLPEPQGVSTLDSMTVVIGAICEDGKAAVIAADRSRTYGLPGNITVETELRETKFVHISDALIAGISSAGFDLDLIDEELELFCATDQQRTVRDAAKDLHARLSR